jgi:hypothetical protein
MHPQTRLPALRQELPSEGRPMGRTRRVAGVRRPAGQQTTRTFKGVHHRTRAITQDVILIALDDQLLHGHVATGVLLTGGTNNFYVAQTQPLKMGMYSCRVHWMSPEDAEDSGGEGIVGTLVGLKFLAKLTAVEEMCQCARDQVQNDDEEEEDTTEASGEGAL